MLLREFIVKQLRVLNGQKILNEGASDILYHFTYTTYLLNILQTNEFSLTSAIGSQSDYEINKKKFFYFSTARSQSSGFKKGDVKIVLDGRKLKYNSKIVPVDYWQWSKNPKDYESKSSYASALASLEQEDRIVSDKPIIPNAIEYIIAIHIYVSKPNMKLKNIIEICKNNNIELYLYDNEKNWLNQIKPISSDIDFSNVEDEDSYKGRSYFDYDIASMIAYNDIDNYNTIARYLNDTDKIKKLDDVLNQLTNNNFRIDGIYFEAGITYMNSALSNIRSKSNEESKFILSLLTKDLKKYGVNNIKDYLLKKQFKGKKTLNDFKKELKRYLVQAMLNDLDEGLNRDFERYIEIDGNYYNHAYESNELIKVAYNYLNKLKEYLDDKIFSQENDIFRYSYVLDNSYLKKHIDFDNIKLSDEINITDSYYDINLIDEDFKNLIDYRLISAISYNYYDKIAELKEKYQAQL
jgi:hypothetical protein